MRHAIATVVAMLASFSACCEQSYIAPLAEKSVLLDVAATNFVVMVGERGHVLLSADGKTFHQADVPSTTMLTAVDIFENNVWAVGHDAVILHSADAGNTWEQQFSAPEFQRPFLDVLFFDDLHGIAVGAYGLFYRTLNGGKSWQPELHATLLPTADREYLEEIKQEDESFYEQELNSILPHINRITNIGDRLFIAGEAGLLAASEDQGKSWARFDVEYTGSFFDIKPLDEKTIMAVGLRGNIFVMRDQGNWQYVNTCSTSTLNSIFVASAEKVVALGNNGMMVALERPLPVSQSGPSADPSQCQPAAGISVTQLEGKAAILNAVTFNKHTLAVTANGIKYLHLD
ncbi:hypothetical protein CA267_018565 [Alteromonas pelagimontana]|uniref:Photosynthesis system II assembly factor Ycf48/Hcf136-like domain-containing protein n=1 Tax=Alteromonas pelagimontana TaxID=1858656 RepID=A0A6M4MHD2_9ALTE|nr:YCF48-related protein [Alteromonas pelagimontana]QJR82611.1 hypothetical protein CA267_018565 [Alteromonas pelagimontana]